ncbi:hypothetical protein L3081_25065 [Colwellia sp. MSW7]|uniref:Uncharacterized protein n=1 Tax=Colwellia maritima TaxID=2912588 RepID=A0ABS9X796_9GAMM|nr:hypothetical protein [Colwellia maritima]MCI2286096.1 hypothetical protein [Colwellia maritima]
MTNSNNSDMPRFKLNRLLGATDRLQTSGVFKSHIDQIAHLEVLLVTCVGNDASSPDYDVDYPIEGVLFEVVSGNETRTFNLANDLKSFIKKHIEDHGARPSSSILLNN